MTFYADDQNFMKLHHSFCFFSGDTFIAATVLSLSRGESAEEAIKFGCQVAGAKVGMHGFDGLRGMFPKK